MEDKDLADQLRQWALEEMRFRPQRRHIGVPVPSKDEFKTLCRGTMIDIWKYVLRHVKSTQTVQKIKGNLKLQDLIQKQAVQSAGSQDEGETQKLKERHTYLTKELLEMKNKVCHVQKEIRNIQKEILTAEEKYTDVRGQISDVAKRNALLTAYSKQCQQLVEMHRGLAKQIDDRVTLYRDIARKKSVEPTYYTSQGIIPAASQAFTAVEGRSTPTGLESACTRSVRECCERIGSFLHELCKADETSGSVEEGSYRKIKDQLWTGVENILSQHPAQDVLTSLSRIAQDSAVSLKELTARIHLKRDAQELKFKYENSGKLTDTSLPPTVLQSVHQLIEEGQAAHFQRFLESEKGLNEAWRGRQRLQTIQLELNAKLGSRYQDSPGNLELARVLHHNELELIASRASLEFIRSELVKLTNSRNEKQRAQEILLMKHKKIKDFEKLTQTKQSLIQALVKQNSSAKVRLENQQSELLQYIQQKICSHEAHVVAMAKQLHDSVTQEVDRFAALPLDLFQYSDLDSARRVPVSELSINRLNQLSSTPGGEPIRTILDNLDFAVFKAPDELLIRTMQLREKVDDTKSIVQSRDGTITQVDDHRSCEKTVERLNGLRREVTQQDRAQMEYVMPLIQSGLGKATKALSECIHVKDIVNSWWEQPAQFVVPWVRLDDTNMRQWRDQWTLSATRLRQLQMRQ